MITISLGYYTLKRIIKTLYNHAGTTVACQSFFHKHVMMQIEIEKDNENVI